MTVKTTSAVSGLPRATYGRKVHRLMSAGETKKSVSFAACGCATPAVRAVPPRRPSPRGFFKPDLHDGSGAQLAGLLVADAHDSFLERELPRVQFQDLC